MCSEVFNNLLIKFIISEFISEVAEDSRIAQKLSDFLKYEQDVRSVKRILWILDLLMENKIEVPESIHHKSLLLLMEKGIFTNLLMRIEVFSDATQQETWKEILNTIRKYVCLKLENTGIYERSLYFKAKIFEKMAIVVHAADILGDADLSLMYTYLIYSYFIRWLGTDYCRSMIRSQVQDGTVHKMAQLLTQHIQAEDILKTISFVFTDVFIHVIKIDMNTVYNSPCKKIVDELRLITPLLIKMLFLNWKGGSKEDRATALRALKIIEIYVIIGSNEIDHLFLKRQRLCKNLSDLCLWEFRSGQKNISQTTELLRLSFSVLSHLRFIKIENFRSLMPCLIKSMRKANCKLSSEENSLLMASTNITCLIVKKWTGLDKDFVYEVLRMNLIPTWVSVIQKFHTSIEMQPLLVIRCISSNMGKLVQEIANEHLLTFIDQIITSFPFFIQYITAPNNLDLESLPSSDVSIACEFGRLFLIVTMRLTRFYDEKLGCINSQLNGLLETELVPCIGKALTTFKNHDTMMLYLKVLSELLYVEDNKKIMKKFVIFLPKIMERCIQLRTFYHDAKDKENIYHQMHYPMMRKAIAYAIEDVSSTVLEGGMVESNLSFWSSVEVSDQRMKYTVKRSFELGDGEQYYDGGAIADVLRGTWAICHHYPHKIFKVLELDSPLFEGCSTDEERVRNLMQMVLDFVGSYLDYSEEYSTDFLLHITAFVRDLDIDPLDPICRSLVAACHRFLEIQKHPGIFLNLSAFAKVLK